MPPFMCDSSSNPELQVFNLFLKNLYNKNRVWTIMAQRFTNRRFLHSVKSLTCAHICDTLLSSTTSTDLVVSLFRPTAFDGGPSSSEESTTCCHYVHTQRTVKGDSGNIYRTVRRNSENNKRAVGEQSEQSANSITGKI